MTQALNKDQERQDIIHTMVTVKGLEPANRKVADPDQQHRNTEGQQEEQHHQNRHDKVEPVPCHSCHQGRRGNSRGELLMGSVESTSADPDKPKEDGSECELIGHHRNNQPRHDCQRDRSMGRAK